MVPVRGNAVSGTVGMKEPDTCRRVLQNNLMPHIHPSFFFIITKLSAAEKSLCGITPHRDKTLYRKSANIADRKSFE